jgi:DNA-binding MarR family transcriptional regulator
VNYIQLMETVARAEGRSGLSELDALSREMLRMIASAHMNSGKVRMTDLRLFGTYPTIQKHVEILVLGDWIQRREDDNDRRIVLLSPLPKTIEAIQAITEDIHRPPGITLRGDCKLRHDKLRHHALAEMDLAFEESKARFLKCSATSE